ncbi:MAG: NAD(P)-binding domain-containing protein, partial [Altererythrobacter sp.]|nr:NAD(P)-binding domain-containing protein [Altererythrobacter sp.]
MKTQSKVAFLGLGVMGGPMAGHLARAGHQVTVYNRTKARAKTWQGKWTDEGLQLCVADTPAEAARGADIVFACVGNDQDVEQIMLGENGALDAMPAGALLVDHTTTSANLARKLFDTCTAKGTGFVDAPVSGGQAGAENGKLAIMCGGTAEDIERATPAMECYAARIVHVGEAG